jgi:hypothetical protein
MRLLNGIDFLFRLKLLKASSLNSTHYRSRLRQAAEAQRAPSRPPATRDLRANLTTCGATPLTANVGRIAPPRRRNDHRYEPGGAKSVLPHLIYPQPSDHAIVSNSDFSNRPSSKALTSLRHSPVQAQLPKCPTTILPETRDHARIANGHCLWHQEADLGLQQGPLAVFGLSGVCRCARYTRFQLSTRYTHKPSPWVLHLVPCNFTYLINNSFFSKMSLNNYASLYIVLNATVTI